MRAHKGFRLLAVVLGVGAVSAQTPQQAPAAPVDQRKVARQQEIEALKKPRSAAAIVKAALAYEVMGDVKASRAAATEALAREANNVPAMQALARLAAREQNWGEAASHLRRAAQLEPNNAATQLALGQALEKLGDQAGSDAAYAAYRSSMGMKPVSNEESTVGR